MRDHETPQEVFPDPGYNGADRDGQNGNPELTVSGDGGHGNEGRLRVFNVRVASPGVVSFSGLTIANGISRIPGYGGGISNNNTGTVNVTNSAILGNRVEIGDEKNETRQMTRL